MFISDMISFVVEMIDYDDQQRQKKWNIVFFYIDTHIFSKVSSSSFELKYSNDRWMKQRQWYLSQSLFLMICTLRCFSKYLKQKSQLRILTNRHKYLIATDKNLRNKLMLDVDLKFEIWHDIRNKIKSINVIFRSHLNRFERLWILFDRVEWFQQQLNDVRDEYRQCLNTIYESRNRENSLHSKTIFETFTNDVIVLNSILFDIESNLL